MLKGVLKFYVEGDVNACLILLEGVLIYVEGDVKCGFENVQRGVNYLCGKGC